MVRKLAVWVVVTLAILVAAGAAYQQWGQQRDAARFPMPGERFDLGGRALHLWCTGSGAVTVLLENGLTAPFAAWRAVQNGIEPHTRVCSYDRAGLAWSDPSPQPSSAAQVVADLDALLSVAGIEGPLILVGWSAGGVYARAFIEANEARGRGREVRGLVLVDSSHEAQGLRLPEFDTAEMLPTLRICAAIARTGALRALGAGETVVAQFGVPDDAFDEHLALFNRTGYCAGVAREMAGFPGDVEDPDGPRSLGDLPLIVIARGRAATAAELGGADDASVAAMNDAWTAMQAELAGLSIRGELWVAQASGHGIPYEQPEIVVRAVRQLLEPPGGGAGGL
jgi:pimeloyl-ACP methyl ester carboxylesterase